MQPYKNLSGKNSGVVAYEAGEDFIIVEFKARQKYRYTYGSAGAAIIEKMKSLAEAGVGLSTFISREKPKYADKFGKG